MIKRGMDHKMRTRGGLLLAVTVNEDETPSLIWRTWSSGWWVTEIYPLKVKAQVTQGESGEHQARLQSRLIIYLQTLYCGDIGILEEK